jgi:SAM-dependent methyltransferase
MKQPILQSVPGRVVTTPVRALADIRAFFDDWAGRYVEQHGRAERLLQYRLALIRKRSRLGLGDAVLDLGCGTGEHLIALAPQIRSGTGIDLSPRMVAVARQQALRAAPGRPLRFEVDNSEALNTVASASFELVLCIGAFEHMLDKAAVLRSAQRVLAPGGRFLCLTPHGDYLWYRWLAPLLGLATRHLSTDRFLDAAELERVLREAGFNRIELGYWTFIPRGDMPSPLGALLRALDLVGRVFQLSSLRGGLWVCAFKAGP